MCKTSVPKIPKEIKDLVISEECLKRLHEWKVMFGKIATEEDNLISDGAENILAQFAMCVTPVDNFNTLNINLRVGNIADIYFVFPGGWEDADNLINFLQKQNIDFSGLLDYRDNYEGTWEKIFNLALNYFKFRERLVPLLPKLEKI
jgi:hypothetical protein